MNWLHDWGKMKNRLIIAFASIIWLAAVTGSYYLTHKPFTLEIARNFALAAWRITIAGAILSVAGGLGRRILPVQGTSLFWLPIHAGLGSGILGTGILLVGLTFGFNVWLFAILLISLGILLRRDIVWWWSRWRGFPDLWQIGGQLGKLIGLGCVILLGFTLFTALAPPLKFDALVYHLTLPKTYLSAGRIEYQPWLIFWGMPQLMEMLFAWAISLGGIQAAPVLAWGIGLLTLVGVADWGAHRISPRAGWVAAACLLSGFTLAISLAWGYVDWLAMLFGLSVLVLLDQWREKLVSPTGRRRPLLLAGLVAGFAIGTKYTAGVLALGGVVVIVLQSWRDGWSKVVKNATWFSLPVILAVLPWLIKNTMFTGNPLYPLIFPAGAMNAVRLALYQNQTAFGDWRDAVFLPWQATMLGTEGGAGYGVSIGPLLLAFGLLGWVGWRIRQENIALSTIITLTLTGLVFWAVSGRLSALAIQTRLYMTVFPAVGLLAGAGFDMLERVQLPGVRLGRVAGVVLLLVFGFNILEVSEYSLRQGALQHLLGFSAPEEYQTTNLGMPALAFKTINELPDQARVLMLWEARSLYCTPSCFPDEIVDRWLADRSEYGAADAILASWRETGYTHLLVYQTGANYYRDDPRYPHEDWQTLDELLASLPVQTDLNQIYTLYSLTP
jgi:hypothetical protein